MYLAAGSLAEGPLGGPTRGDGVEGACLTDGWEHKKKTCLLCSGIVVATQKNIRILRHTIEPHTQTRRHADTQTRRHADTQTRRHADTQTRRHADTDNRHTDTQTHTDTHTDTQTQTHTQTQTDTHGATPCTPSFLSALSRSKCF